MITNLRARFALNPVTLKELRQMVRSRLVSSGLIAFLFLQVAVVSIALLAARSASSDPLGQSYGDVVFDTWQGVVTTKGVPPAVLDALNREMVKALRNPEVLRSHEEQVNVVVANTPEQFERFVAEETAKWGAVVKETGVTPG